MAAGWRWAFVLRCRGSAHRIPAQPVLSLFIYLFMCSFCIWPSQTRGPHRALLSRNVREGQMGRDGRVKRAVYADPVWGPRGSGCTWTEPTGSEPQMPPFFWRSFVPLAERTRCLCAFMFFTVTQQEQNSLSEKRFLGSVVVGR